MKPVFKFHPKVVLRTPLFPKILGSHNREDILHFFKSPLAQEALYLASPNLLREYHKWESDELKDDKEIIRLVGALAKYYYRMHHRTTPFGLFAGLTVLEWQNSPEAEIRLADSEIQRHTRLDMTISCSLVALMESDHEVRKHLWYFPNSSLYHFNQEWRFVEYFHNEDGTRRHQISSVEAAEHITAILSMAEHGVMLKEVVAALTSDEVSEDEAWDFVFQLVDTQILVSELGATLTGEEYLHRLQKILTLKIANSHSEILSKYADFINFILDQLKTLDRSKAYSAKKYLALMNHIRTELPNQNDKNVFQLDFYRPAIPGYQALNNQITKKLSVAIEALKKLTAKPEVSRLEQFKTKFLERYEGNEQPLLEVLDSENGVGYNHNAFQDENILTRDLALPSAPTSTQEFKWDAAERWKNSRLVAAIENQETVVNITKQELDALPEKTTPFPPSFSCVFRTLSGQQLYLENVGNPSAINLLGRFGHLHPEISKIIREVAESEHANNPDMIFAEVVHLPESRIGNIVQRPQYRDYEIPYLALASVNEKNQILLRDITITIAGGEIILRWQKTGQRIIPRLGSAHNFSFNAQPVYQFLCDLQLQGTTNYLYFDWGPLSEYYSYLPRVCYHDVVLYPGTWQLKTAQIKAIVGQKTPAKIVTYCQTQHRLPDRFYLADGDNELLINFKDPLSVEIWIKAITNRSQIILREYLADEHSQVKTEDGLENYENQYVATVMTTQANYQLEAWQGSLIPKEALMHGSVQFRYFPDSNWLYYKLYSGPKSLDEILIKSIAPLTNKLTQMGVLDKWFFIRYNDPHSHLRLRLLATSAEAQKDIQHLCEHYFRNYQESGVVWKIQLDTYQREVSRYGYNSIDLIEHFFYRDSEATLGFLALQSDTSNENIRWQWGLRSTNWLLNDLGYSLTDKVRMTKPLKDSFAFEFHADQALRRQLAQKYRRYQSDLNYLLTEANSTTINYDVFLEQRSQHLGPILAQLLDLQEHQQLQLPLDSILMSCVHMLFNRVFPSFQRKQELVAYDMLHTHYKSLRSQQKHPEQQRSDIVLS